MYEITIKQLTEQPAAVIAATTTPTEIGDVLMELLPAAWAAVEQAGRSPAGPPLVRYLSFSDDAVELEGGLPVDAPIAPGDRIQPITIPAGEAAVTWHVGHYDGIKDAHMAVHQWVADNNRRFGAPPYEVYWTDPGEEPDPAKWRTEIVVPLAPADA